jgi:hypothetical protein
MPIESLACPSYSLPCPTSPVSRLLSREEFYDLVGDAQIYTSLFCGREQVTFAYQRADWIQEHHKPKTVCREPFWNGKDWVLESAQLSCD